MLFKNRSESHQSAIYSESSNCIEGWGGSYCNPYRGLNCQEMECWVFGLEHKTWHGI